MSSISISRGDLSTLPTLSTSRSARATDLVQQSLRGSELVRRGDYRGAFPVLLHVVREVLQDISKTSKPAPIELVTALLDLSRAFREKKWTVKAEQCGYYAQQLSPAGERLEALAVLAQVEARGLRVRADPMLEVDKILNELREAKAIPPSFAVYCSAIAHDKQARNQWAIALRYWEQCAQYASCPEERLLGFEQGISVSRTLLQNGRVDADSLVQAKRFCCEPCNLAGLPDTDRAASAVGMTIAVRAVVSAYHRKWDELETQAVEILSLVDGVDRFGRPDAAALVLALYSVSLFAAAQEAHLEDVSREKLRWIRGTAVTVLGRAHELLSMSESSREISSGGCAGHHSYQAAWSVDYWIGRLQVDFLEQGMINEVEACEEALKIVRIINDSEADRSSFFKRL